MERHYRMTDEFTVNEYGTKLYRIELIKDCIWGKVGDKGGFIEKYDNLKGNAWVGDNACVFDNARVFGNACVSGYSNIFENACVFGDAWIFGYANVFGDSLVFGNSCVFEYALIFGYAHVFQNARVFGDAHILGYSSVLGYSKITGGSWDKSPLQIDGSRNYFNVSKHNHIQIGCMEHTFDYWKENFDRIGKEKGYTNEQIKEYGNYIDLAINQYKL